MLGPNRNSRIENLLKRDLANIILQEVKDPRITNWVSVSDVNLSKDRAFATIYITMLGNEDEHKQAVDALNKAVSFIRTELTKRVDLKYIPKLKFCVDRSIIEGNRISTLIKD